MYKKFKTEAIILKRKDLLNKDLIITVFTKEKGKLNLFAKGIKKITSRRLSYIQTGNLLDIILEKRKDFYYLSEVNLISGFLKIKEDNKKINILFKYLFILDKLLPENQKELVSYNLTKKFFIDLSKEKNIENFSEKILNDHLNKLLISLGYINKHYSYKEIILTIQDLINDKIIHFDI